MTKDIIKDKFLGPISIVLLFALFNIKRTNDLFFLLIILLIGFTILSIAGYLRNDLYIKHFSLENGILLISFQKNFSKNIEDKIFHNSKSLDLVKFRSKSFLDSFHIITVRFQDENGFYDTKSFKTNDDKTFIELIYKLNKEKAKHNS
jgi:uncharacterized protein with PQ loop repeat